MESIFNYYGIDWVAMALSLLAMYLIGNQNRLGFVAFILSNFLWIIVSVFMIHSYGVILGSSIFFFINLRGFLKWKKQPKDIIV